MALPLIPIVLSVGVAALVYATRSKDYEYIKKLKSPPLNYPPPDLVDKSDFGIIRSFQINYNDAGYSLVFPVPKPLNVTGIIDEDTKRAIDEAIVFMQTRPDLNRPMPSPGTTPLPAKPLPSIPGPFSPIQPNKPSQPTIPPPIYTTPPSAVTTPSQQLKRSLFIIVPKTDPTGRCLYSEIWIDSTNPSILKYPYPPYPLKTTGFYEGKCIPLKNL